MVPGGQVEQFPVPIPFQEAIESLHEAGLEVGIGLGDVLHVGADEDQAAGAAFAFADRNPGTNAGFSSFKFGLFFRQSLHKVPLFFLVQKPANIELFLVMRDHGHRVSWWERQRIYGAEHGTRTKERAHLLVSRKARNVRATLMLNMAIFHLTVKTGSRLGGQSARAKADYIEREGKYERQDDELAHRESENMPEWAEEDPRSYWEAADEHERVNGRLFREVEFALPRELNEGDQVELAREFASKLTSAGGERLPYTLAVHRGQGENPHAHLMISERANDGIKRSREQQFKRYNSKEPEKGGARKSMATRPKDWLEQTRKDWANHANQALERAGSRERITGASLEQQYRDALEAGDERGAARLKYREPGVHIGPHNVARAERGVALERTATARAVEDRNQEFKSDRADVREMEGTLARVRENIAEIVQKLAAYVRARLERSRGRSGPDRGWSR